MRSYFSQKWQKARALPSALVVWHEGSQAPPCLDLVAVKEGVELLPASRFGRAGGCTPCPCFLLRQVSGREPLLPPLPFRVLAGREP